MCFLHTTMHLPRVHTRMHIYVLQYHVGFTVHTVLHVRTVRTVDGRKTGEEMACGTYGYCRITSQKGLVCHMSTKQTNYACTVCYVAQTVMCITCSITCLLKVIIKQAFIKLSMHVPCTVYCTCTSYYVFYILVHVHKIRCNEH